MKRHIKIIVVLGAVFMLFTAKHNLLSNEEDDLLTAARAEIDIIDREVRTLSEQLKTAGNIEEFSIAQKQAKLIKRKNELEKQYPALRQLQQVTVRESLIKKCPELKLDLLWKQTRMILDHDNSHGGCFSPDGKLLVTVSNDKVKIWYVYSGYLKKVFAYDNNPSSISRPHFSPDGKYLMFYVLINQDQNVVVVDIATGKELYHHQTGHFYTCVSEIFGNKIITGSASGITIRDVATGEPLHTLTPPLIPGNNIEITGGSMSRDGRYILMEVSENEEHIVALVWDMPRAKKLYALFSYGPEADFYDDRMIEFSPDGNYIIRNRGNSAVLLDARTGVQKHILVHNGPVEFAYCDTELFSHDSKWVVTYDKWEGADSPQEEGAGIGATAIIWNVQTGEPIHTLQHDGITRAIFSPNGKYVLTMSEQELKVWNAQTGETHAQIVTDDSFGEFSPDSSLVIINHSSMWDIKNYGPMPLIKNIYPISFDEARPPFIYFDLHDDNLFVSGPKSVLFLNINKLLNINKASLTIDQCDLLRAIQMQFIRKEFLEKLSVTRRAGRKLIEPIKLDEQQWHTFRSLPRLLQPRLIDYIIRPR